jgi:hypothetical protein
VLLKRFQISESLVVECEALDEARPPHRVAKISVFHWCCDESVLLKLCWSRGVDDRVGSICE